MNLMQKLLMLNFQ